MQNNQTRRAFLQNGSLFLLGAGTTWSRTSEVLAAETKPQLRVGLVTDLHYADKAPAGSRHYRESLTKLDEAAARFQKDKINLLVELGDFIDAADSVETELAYLKKINQQFAKITDDRHYVLGNHCVFTLTKDEFLEGVGKKKSYYSFDKDNFHFIVLDSCFTSDGTPYGRKNFEWTDPNIPAEEIDWLRNDLKQTTKKAIVFAHQRLDVSNHYGVKNAPQVRKSLEQSGNVLAVFQGHSHKNDHKQINGIHYCTLVAMVEGSGVKNNGYSTLDLFPNGMLKISGHRKQDDYAWNPRKAASD